MNQCLFYYLNGLVMALAKKVVSQPISHNKWLNPCFGTWSWLNRDSWGGHRNAQDNFWL